jgi:hypothetical protein
VLVAWAAVLAAAWAVVLVAWAAAAWAAAVEWVVAVVAEDSHNTPLSQRLSLFHQ